MIVFLLFFEKYSAFLMLPLLSSCLDFLDGCRCLQRYCGMVSSSDNAGGGYHMCTC
jgi:phosphatidylglycerophosphate synthase